ncbi:hypothetical protein HZA40_03700 [Candidatus Peregrinibacteria bacterium]|nr:hypothetical protein [Candidatus Peregrinibacteria bacterium]
MAGPDRGSSWLDGLEEQVHAVFPDCVVAVNGVVLGTKAEMAARVAHAFEVDGSGRLPDDPDSVDFRTANLLDVTDE